MVEKITGFKKVVGRSQDSKKWSERSQVSDQRVRSHLAQDLPSSSLGAVTAMASFNDVFMCDQLEKMSKAGLLTLLFLLKGLG